MDEVVERVAEAIWRAEAPRSGIVNRPWSATCPTDRTKDDCRRQARAAIEALQLPVEWGFGIPHEGSFDANLQVFYSRSAAKKGMADHNGIFPNDRRCLITRFGKGPWVRVGGDE